MPTQKSARKWRCNFSRHLARTITKGIHSCQLHRTAQYINPNPSVLNSINLFLFFNGNNLTSHLTVYFYFYSLNYMVAVHRICGRCHGRSRQHGFSVHHSILQRQMETVLKLRPPVPLSLGADFESFRQNKKQSNSCSRGITTTKWTVYDDLPLQGQSNNDFSQLLYIQYSCHQH